ncbi:MAG TPA: cobalt transporter CbiM [Rhizomicrobium sp.]|jgi:cobalt/nickel transport system permease protein|nr:cobalt transporter CbiM [Rhizomicrobium sp.]
MHIPDGYLGPSTCLALFGGAAPFWWISLRRMKRALHTRTVPLLSLFSAFSFIVMMFNLPLPGGTTGHAVGMGIASIVLGPWAAILAISIALTIQAVFFGDGGITAIGANCFNMAIVGSLVSYCLYRAVSGRAAIRSSRRVIAAGIAGYTAINVSALLAAIEFGIQPALYHDASGAPLYAPYPLHIAIPAMTIGHLTVAGLAEMVISAGVVGYLQRAEPGLLKNTAPGAVLETEALPPATARPLWIALALLMILTPLGILAAGAAWGEWAPREFVTAPQKIAAASGNHPLPAAVPSGLQRLSSFWTAPMPGYAPPFLKNPSFGYLLSAVAGTGIVLLVCALAGFFTRGSAP